MFQSVDLMAEKARSSKRAGRSPRKAAMLERCLGIARLLYADLQCSVEQLTVEFKVSRRTIFRDMLSLRAAGLKIESDPVHHRYLLVSEDIAPRISKQDIEAIVLSQIVPVELRPAAYRDGGFPLARLMVLLPRQRRESLQNLLLAIEPNSNRGDVTYASEAVAVVIKSIECERAVRITYRLSESGEPIATKLSPMRLSAIDSEWSVVGRSSLHRRTCAFRLSRIVTAELTDDPLVGLRSQTATATRL